MAKDKLTEYSATNASNDVIGDISVAEGMLPSAVNNALREQMTHLKNFSDGTDAIDALAVDNLKLDGNTISSTDTNGNVNIDPDGTGETVIDSSVRITKTSGAPTLLLTDNDTSGDGTIDASDGNLRFYSDNDGEVAGSLMGFYVDGSEAMRLTAGGNLNIGKTADGIGTAGLALRGDVDIAQFTRSGGEPLELNRLSNDGALIIFYQDGTQVGSIGTVTDKIYIGSSAGGDTYLRLNSNTVTPANSSGADRDATINLGYSGGRFQDIFATNGTIQTSDANEKQQIAALTDAEMTAAKAISQLFKTFKWNDSVVEKGDAARTHTGVIAQEVQAAMSDAGLDAANYAFWCSDTWTNDDGNEQTRMGVRYPQLLAFIGAATEQRLADIETRLAALEA